MNKADILYFKDNPLWEESNSELLEYLKLPEAERKKFLEGEWIIQENGSNKK